MATLVAGSYEKFIWGFSLRSETLTLKPLFSSQSHTAPIKSVAAASPLAASGGSDGFVKLYDLRASIELGSLPYNGGTVTALAFFASPLAPTIPRNLLSASDDGDVRIYDADPFVHLKSVPAHRGGVADLAVHPSGRAALTVGRDSCLALLNLIRGRRSFSCRLDREASIVRYEPGDGSRFFVVAEGWITVHDSADARMIHEMDAEKKVLCISPTESGLLFTGGEDRCITCWDTSTGKVAHRIENAHSARIKGLAVLRNSDEAHASGLENLIASASSDGVIRIWDARMTSKENPTPLTEASTKARLTCLAASSKCEYFSFLS